MRRRKLLCKKWDTKNSRLRPWKHQVKSGFLFCFHSPHRDHSRTKLLCAMHSESKTEILFFSLIGCLLSWVNQSEVLIFKKVCQKNMIGLLSPKFCNCWTILICWLNCVINLEVNCFLPHYCSTCTFLRIMGDFLLRPTLCSRPNFGLHWGQPKKGFLLPESIIYISFFYMRVLCHNVSMLQQRNFFPYFFNGSNHLL